MPYAYTQYLLLFSTLKLSNPNIYEKLGMDTVLREAQRNAQSDEARQVLAETLPTADAATLLPMLRKTQEFKDILQYDDPFPADSLSGVTVVLRKAAIEGNWLTVAELHSLLRWLNTLKKVRAYVQSRREKYPMLHELVNVQGFSAGLIVEIERVIDEYGNLRDNASPALASIRRSLVSAGVELRTTMNRLLRKLNDSGWGAADEITLRNDRFVLPVKADAKGRVAGFVQDISQSGNTVYIEPAETLPLNNRLRELQIEEQNEIVRILQEVTAKIFVYVDELLGFRDAMLELDIIRAKAMLAIKLNATLPKLQPNGTTLSLREARYPLLVLKGAKVIPLNVQLSEKTRILVISGPNAGGKSVALKTVGLLQLMLQCGFLIPCDERSEFRLFDSLFIDIGDSQSVESDLSTYTSHLAIMRQMGDQMSAGSLFLIDEFGGGTDPQLGGSIAEAFLERFINQRACGIITTHYGNLKDYAEVTAGVSNAAMQFDVNGLQPTFSLVEGLPGRSYAFEIAEKVGVHSSILKRARKKIGTESISSEKLIKQLEAKVANLEKLVSDTKRQEQELAVQRDKYEKLNKELTTHRKKLMEEAKLQAQNVIKQANKEVERTIREIREAQAEKERTRQLRERLQAAAPEVDEAFLEEMQQPAIAEITADAPANAPKKHSPKAERKAKMQPEAPQVLEGTPVVGDYVKLGLSNGQLVELQGNRAVVLVGEVRMNVKLSQLTRISAPKQPTERGGVLISVTKKSQAKMELDVMGMRVEEALAATDKFIDDALYAGLQSVSILHGKGTGALKDALRSHLRSLPHVVRLGDAPEEMGGAGWTLLELKAV